MLIWLIFCWSSYISFPSSLLFKLFIWCILLVLIIRSCFFHGILPSSISPFIPAPPNSPRIYCFILYSDNPQSAAYVLFHWIIFIFHVHITAQREPHTPGQSPPTCTLSFPISAYTLMFFSYPQLYSLVVDDILCLLMVLYPPAHSIFFAIHFSPNGSG